MTGVQTCALPIYPFKSNFFKYFVLNFNKLKLKKLIATCYSGSRIAGKQLSLFDVDDSAEEGIPYKAIVTEVYDATGDGGITMNDIAELFKLKKNILSNLSKDGDFRSKECLELMDESDIIVTNPPFSLFSDFISTLTAYKKDFLILGNPNAVTYKEVFPLIKDNKIWLGYKPMSKDMYFHVTDDMKQELLRTKKEGSGYVIIDNEVYGRTQAIWYTNLDIKKRHEDLILIKKYKGHEKDYPKYDNYDAINVKSIQSIPEDYDGVMGVPISILDSYNPDQFEILGSGDSKDIMPEPIQLSKKFVDAYFAQGGRGHYSNNMYALALYDTDGKAKVPFKRILVRNKHPEEM